MKTEKPIDWDFVSSKFLQILRTSQIVLGVFLLSYIIYVSVQKGRETGSTQGLLLWIIVGVIVAIILGAFFAGMELLLHFTSNFNEWLIAQFGRHVEIRRRIIMLVAAFFLVLPFALFFIPSFWTLVTDNLLRAIILASLFAFSSALLSVAREERASNRISRLALLESALSNRVPLLTNDEITHAIKMAQVYVILYCYENSVRKLVEKVLSQELGENWWNVAASDAMKRSAESRQQTEQNRRWISPRGTTSPLYYLDWGDMEKLMRKYDKLFSPYIGELRFIESRFGDLESLRNIVAHHGILPSEDDFQRVRLSFSDWSRQVGKALGKP